MINTNKLKGKIAELGFNQKDIASTLNISLPTVSQKINGRRRLYLDEAEQIADLLQIDDTQFCDYFFAQ